MRRRTSARSTLQTFFDNPARQPYIVEIKGWKAAYDGVINGTCEGTILPLTNLKKFDGESKRTKIIHTHRPYPNQAFTTSPRISPELRDRIAAALNSPEGKAVTKALREQFAKGADLVPASKEEYIDVANVLKSYYGFEF
jgi:ABC-type phosphate/phosphonate transport system substrate-binding protein